MESRMMSLKSDREMEIQKMKHGQHILGIYPSLNEELKDAFVFLKKGLKNNELVMLITDHLSKTTLKQKIQQNLNYNISELELKNQIILKSVSEWYFENGVFSKNMALHKWKSLEDYAKSCKYNGIQVFADLSYFFRSGYDDELLKFEEFFDLKFDLPVTAVCAYTYPEIDSLSSSEFHTLQYHHEKILV